MSRCFCSRKNVLIPGIPSQHDNQQWISPMNQHEFIVSNWNYSLVQSPIDERSQLPSQPLFSIRINSKYYLTFIALRLIFINTSRLLELKALLKERKAEERYMETSFQYFFYTVENLLELWSVFYIMQIFRLLLIKFSMQSICVSNDSTSSRAAMTEEWAWIHRELVVVNITNTKIDCTSRVNNKFNTFIKKSEW